MYVLLTCGCEYMGAIYLIYIILNFVLENVTVSFLRTIISPGLFCMCMCYSNLHLTFIVIFLLTYIVVIAFPCYCSPNINLIFFLSFPFLTFLLFNVYP